MSEAVAKEVDTLEDAVAEGTTISRRDEVLRDKLAHEETSGEAIEDQVPERVPWWKRLFARMGKPQDGGAPEAPEEELLVGQDEQVRGVVIERAPDEVVEAEVPERAPWWKRICPAAPRPEEEAAPGETPVEATAPPEGTPPLEMPFEETEGEKALPGELPAEEIPSTPYPLLPTPPLAPDDIRDLVRKELAHAQDDIARLVQAELAREQEEHRRISLTAAQETAETVYAFKTESVRMEVEVLIEEERRTLPDRDRPLHERMEEVDYIRERMARAEQEIADLEKAAARRAAKTANALAELEVHGAVAELREELERQKEQISRYANQDAARRPMLGLGAGLVPTLAALALVAAVGVAGILLPRQAGPDARLLVEVAGMYQALGKDDQAIRVLGEAPEAGMRDAQTLGQAGELYRLVGQYDEAIPLLERAVRQEPRDETYRLSLARSYESAGKSLEAIAEYDALVEIDPTNVWYYAEMGHRYKSLRDYDQALAQYRKMLEIGPNVWQAYHYQGDVYLALEKYDEAIAQYQKVLEMNPNYYWTRVHLGFSYTGKGEGARAVEHIQAAIALDPQQAAAYRYLGEVYLAQGEFERALEPYRQAIERNDRYTAAYVGLGQAYLGLDDCANATVQFTLALALNSNDTAAQEGLAACTGQ